MRKILISLLSLVFSTLYAQEKVETITVRNDQGENEEIELPQGMLSATDSLYLDWISKNYITPISCESGYSNPNISDSVYIDRLQRIPAIIEMPYNDIIKKFIDQYTTKLRETVSFMLSANNLYMPIFEEALEIYGLPLELRYLPVIESALNPNAVSRQGATGLWQFMLKTGKIYGLEVNSLIDERRDPIIICGSKVSERSL